MTLSQLDKACNKNSDCKSDELFCYNGTFYQNGHCDYKLGYNKRCYGDDNMCKPGLHCDAGICNYPWTAPPQASPSPDLYDYSKPHWYCDVASKDCKPCGGHGCDNNPVDGVCRYGDVKDPRGLLGGIVACGIRTRDYNAGTTSSRGGAMGFSSEETCQRHCQLTAPGILTEGLGPKAPCLNGFDRRRDDASWSPNVPGKTFKGCAPLAPGERPCETDADCQSSQCRAHACLSAGEEGPLVSWTCPPSASTPFEHKASCVTGRQTCGDFPHVNELAESAGKTVQELCRCDGQLHDDIKKHVCEQQHVRIEAVPLMSWRVLPGNSGTNFSWQAGRTQQDVQDAAKKKAGNDDASKWMKRLATTSPLIALGFEASGFALGGKAVKTVADALVAFTGSSASTEKAFAAVKKKGTSVISTVATAANSHCSTDATLACQSNNDCPLPADGKCLGLLENSQGNVLLAEYACPDRYLSGTCQKDDVWVATLATFGSDEFVDALVTQGGPDGNVMGVTRSVPQQSGRRLAPRWPNEACADAAIDPYCQFLNATPVVSTTEANKALLASQVCVQNKADAELSVNMNETNSFCDYTKLNPPARYRGAA